MKKNPYEKKLTVFGIAIAFVLLLQVILTYGFTNTKIFSFRALIRNVSIIIPIVYGIQYIWVPILLEFVIEYLRYTCYYFEKYIATTYLFNDVHNYVNRYPLLTNYSEANYDGLLGIDMTDYSQENLKRVRDWGQKTYYETLKHPSTTFTDLKGEKHDTQIKYKSDNQKFDYICKKCNIQPGMKILEIGFGHCDFLIYIREHYGIDAVGISIANEHVKKAKELGFEAYCLDAWDITEEIGKFDLVLQCGNIEYMLLLAEPKEKYKDYCNIIKQILNPGGKYFITCCHMNKPYKRSFSDLFKTYILCSGNDGCYPNGSDGFTKYAQQVGFKVLYQEDRTFDYYVACILYFSFLRCMTKKDTVVDAIDLSRALLFTIAAPYYIHSYICYQPSEHLPIIPFVWEFEPQPQEDKLDFPVTLQYILFQV